LAKAEKQKENKKALYCLAINENATTKINLALFPEEHKLN
jgi:hypothetical protein